MIWSEYRGIDKLVLEKAFIQTYQCMGVWTYGRAIETIEDWNGGTMWTHIQASNYVHAIDWAVLYLC